jgi:hypothetical protein
MPLALTAAGVTLQATGQDGETLFHSAIMAEQLVAGGTKNCTTGTVGIRVQRWTHFRDYGSTTLDRFKAGTPQ